MAARCLGRWSLGLAFRTGIPPVAARLLPSAFCQEQDGGVNDFGSLHHVELQVSDLESSVEPWAWLFDALGYEPYQEWSGGRSWRHDATYIVLARAPRNGAHDRRLPGLSHLAFHAGTRQNVDRL